MKTDMEAHLEIIKKENDFMKSGGAHIGAVHSWIQWNCVGGDSVTWGSDEVLRKDFTVKDLENLAKKIALATLKEKGYFK